MAEEALSPERTIAVILGASAWPDFDTFQSSNAFRNSAEAFRDYTLSRSGLNLPKRNLKYLFDTHNDPPDVLDELVRFTRERITAIEQRDPDPINLIVYYVGHGGFANPTSDYFLAMRSTRHSDPYVSSLPITSLSRALNEAGRHIRRYLILDCCFAAAAYRFFQSEGPLGVAAIKVADAFPRSGTALLCASGARDPAKSPAHLSMTMFTGALLSVLNEGAPSAPGQLSLQDVGYLVRRRIAEDFADEGVRPEVLAPEQRHGRVDEIPIFPNIASVNRRLNAEAAKPNSQLAMDTVEVAPSKLIRQSAPKRSRKKLAVKNAPPRQTEADGVDASASQPMSTSNASPKATFKALEEIPREAPADLITASKPIFLADAEPIVENGEFLCVFTLPRSGQEGLNTLAMYLNGLQDAGMISGWRSNGWEDTSTKLRANIKFRSRVDAIIAIKNIS